MTGTSDLRFNHSDLIITRLDLYVHFSRYNATIAMWCDCVFHPLYMIVQIITSPQSYDNCAYLHGLLARLSP